MNISDKIHKLLSARAVVFILMIAVLCCGCTDAIPLIKTGYYDDEGEKITEELPEDEVIAIRGFYNYAWGYTNYMRFIMSDGKVYSSNIDSKIGVYDHSGEITDEQKGYLLEKYTEPDGEISMKDLHKLYHYMLKIDTGAEIIRDYGMLDAGIEYTIVYIDGEPVMTYEFGQRTWDLDDSCAVKVNDLISNALCSVKTEINNCLYVKSSSVIMTVRCPDTIKGETRRIINDAGELEKFRQDTGIDLMEYKYFDYFSNSEYDEFSNTCIAVELVEYPDYLSLGDVTADAFIISDDYVGFAYLNDPDVDENIDGTAMNRYCHVVRLPKDHKASDYEPFLKGS